MTATLPSWMRNALFATAAMNFFAALGFLPPATGVRALTGLPPGEHPLYLMTVALFVMLFAIGYFWVAAANRPERLFITLAAIGKLGFFLVVLGCWLGGLVPALAAVAASADLVFAAIFAAWLLG
jgi:hypothetical protein